MRPNFGSVAESIAKAVFGLLFERSTEVVLVADRATQVVLAANPPAEELLAAGRVDVIGRPFSALLFDPERDVSGAGHYEDVGLRRSDDYPVYVELDVIHVDDPAHGALVAYIARDTTERRILQLELVAKHTALHGAYADLERAHAQLTATKLALERSNHEIASLSFRATLGELVAGIAHHLNNPVAALVSTVTRLETVARTIESDQRAELDKLLSRVARITARVEANVAAIVNASRAASGKGPRTTVPPELAGELSRFTEQLDDIPTKESA